MGSRVGMGWRGAEPPDRLAGGSAHPNALGLLAGVQPLVLYQRSRLAALLLVRAAHLPVDDLVRNKRETTSHIYSSKVKFDCFEMFA